NDSHSQQSSNNKPLHQIEARVFSLCFDIHLTEPRKKSAKFDIAIGRPGGNRTLNLRIWRPSLCQLCYWPKNGRADYYAGLNKTDQRLFDDLGNHASTNGTATFANCEAQTFFHRDRSDQGDNHFDVVARHYHFYAFRQFAVTGHVSGTEVELRTVAFEERSVTSAFFLAQNVDFAFELGVRLDGARLGQNLTTLDVITLGTAQQNTNVLTGTTFVKQFAEHLDTSTGGLGGLADTNDLDLFLDANDTALNTTGHNSTAAGDGEHVFDRHQERTIDGAHRLRNVAIQSLDQGLNGSSTQTVIVFTIERHQRGADDDRSVVAREVVGRQQVANFHLDQFQQLGVVNHVGLVQEHDDVGNTNLTGQQDVLASLRHGAISSGANQDRAVHLGSTGDHVLHIVSVTRAVNVGVVTDRGIIFNVGGVDGDTTSLLFRRVIDLVVTLGSTAATEDFGADTGQGCSQRGLAMVDVTNGADVDVRFVTFEFFFSHDSKPLTYRAESTLFFDNSFDDVRRSFGVLREFHGVAGATLRHGTHISGIAEHFAQRHFSADDLAGDRVFHTLNQTTTTVQVTHHVAHVVLRCHNLDLHDRLKQYRTALLGQLLGGHGSRDLERHLVGVDVVVRTIEHSGFQAEQRIAGENTVLHLLFDALLDSRNVFLRNHTTDNLVLELQAFRTLIGRLEADPAMTKLATTAGLTNKLAFDLALVANHLAIGNLRLTDV